MSSGPPDARHGGGFGFEDVVVDRDGVRALDGFTGELPGSGVTVLSGPSGSGKTTLLRLCNRLEVPTSGRVCFRGVDVAELDPLRLRRRVGMVFQRPVPFPGTVRDNLLVAEPAATEADLRRALDRAALDVSLLDRDAATLSGGEAQRMCVARTLVTAPEVLLLDEPTASLDADAAAVLERAVRELTAGGMAVVWVSHDPLQAHRVGDRIVHLRGGRCVRVEPARRRSAP